MFDSLDDVRNVVLMESIKNVVLIKKSMRAARRMASLYKALQRVRLARLLAPLDVAKKLREQPGRVLNGNKEVISALNPRDFLKGKAAMTRQEMRALPVRTRHEVEMSA